MNKGLTIAGAVVLLLSLIAASHDAGQLGGGIRDRVEHSAARRVVERRDDRVVQRLQRRVDRLLVRAVGSACGHFSSARTRGLATTSARRTLWTPDPRWRVGWP